MLAIAVCGDIEDYGHEGQDVHLAALYRVSQGLKKEFARVVLKGLRAFPDCSTRNPAI